MKQLTIILFCLLALTVGCGKKKENRVSRKDFVERYISDMKTIESPASEAFTAFVDAMGSYDSTNSESEKLIDSLAGVSQAECLKASEQFLVLSNSLPQVGLEDTLRIAMDFAAKYLSEAYKTRAMSMVSISRYLQLGDQRTLESYYIALDLAKENSQKGFFWISAARQRVIEIEQ